MSSKKNNKRIEKAKNLIIKSKYKKALLLFSKVIKKNYRNTEALFERAKLLYDEGHTLVELRKKMFLKDKKLQIESFIKSDIIRYLEKLFINEDFEKKKEYEFFQDLIKIIRINRNHIPTWNFIKKNIFNVKDKFKIIEIILSIAPDNKDALTERFVLYRRMKNNEQELKYLLVYLEKYPTDIPEYVYVGRIYMKKKQYYKAYEAFLKVKREKYTISAIFQIKKLARLGDNKAKVFLQKINEPQKSFYKSGLEYFKADDYKKATKYFWKVLHGEDNEHNKTKAILFEGISKYFASLIVKVDNKLKKFHTALQKTLQKEGKSRKLKTSTLLFAQIYEEAGFFEYAKKYYDMLDNKKMQKARKENSVFKTYIDKIHDEIHKNQNLNKAILAIDKAISKFGEKELLSEYRATAHYELGQSYKYEELFLLIIEENPSNFVALKTLTEIKTNQKDFVEAKYYLKKLITKYGKKDWLKDMINKIPDFYYDN